MKWLSNSDSIKVNRPSTPVFRRLVYRLRFSSGMRTLLLDYEDVFREVFEDFQYVYPEFESLKVNILWDLNTEIFDAEAWRAGNGNQEVRISIACLSQLQSLSNAVFSSRDCYPKIGSIEKCQHTFSEILDGVVSGENDAPNCALRHEAACIVTEICLAMLLLHEIGHHALQHFELLGAPMHLKESSRMMKRSDTKMACLLHACEIEADSLSFGYVLKKASQGKSPFGQQLVSEQLRGDMFGLAVLAFSLVTALLHEEQIQWQDYEELEHPHPALRILASQYSFLYTIGDDEAVISAYQNMLRDAAYVFKHNADQVETFRMLQQNRELLDTRIRNVLSELNKRRDALGLSAPSSIQSI